MNDLMESIRSAIHYMEENLTEPLEIEKIAEQAYMSAFHFQRIFHVLCGFTVGEYIRSRRLTLAAQELAATHSKIIDVALKYGYDSPDSFTRAFQRFHGVTPSQARKEVANLVSFAPVHIKLTLEGGNMLEYRIEEKPQFTVMGFTRRFNTDSSYQAIPEFWQEHTTSAASRDICGAFGICIDSDGKNFDYMIADNYIPWQAVPAGCATRVIPGGTWAIFPCRGALPHALQSVNTRIWSEWLPDCKSYRLAGNYNIEMYAPPQPDPQNDYCEIWVPVEKL